MDSLTAHAQSLKTRHSDLEKKIAEELNNKAPDTIRVSQLKKQKLAIKEELTDIFT